MTWILHKYLAFLKLQLMICSKKWKRRKNLSF